MALDLNQKTMQALDSLAEEYEIFEETMKKVTLETEEGDMLFAVDYEVGEELEDRQQDDLEFTCEGMGPCTMLRVLTSTIRAQK